MDCDDGNPCTDDACNTQSNTCSRTTNTSSCNDANACTNNDVCAAGSCAGTPISCNDGNLCTDDSCNTSTGCVYANNTAACNDANACTTPDACASGACRGAYAPTPGCCTTTAQCNDGNAGTNDVCTAGTCSNPVTCTTNAECDDLEVCTTDRCTAAGGAAIEFDGANDYLNLGNGGNTASVNYLTNFGTGSFTIEGWFRADTATTYMGLFRQGSQNAYPQVVVQFPGASPYNRIAGSIETSTSGTQVDATVPTNFTLGQWYHYAMVADRTPGAQKLTVYLHDSTGALVDSAQSGADVWGTYAINDTYTGTPPNEVRDPVVLGVARTPSPGANYNYYFAGRIDEVRIWDHARTPQQLLDNVRVRIAAATGLVHRWAMDEGTGTTTADSGSTPTTAGTLVNGPTWRTLTADLPPYVDGVCEHTAITGCCHTDTECNDGNVCTDDSCNLATNQCEHLNNTAACDDGLYCNGADSCAGATCTHVGDPCSGGLLCDEGTDSCVECLTAGDCDDANICTNDACVGGTCANTPNTASCDDATVCNGHEVCSGGNCQAGVPLECSDGNVCTDDSCNAVSGCQHSNNTAACDDGLFCTVTDVCSNSTCAGSARDCSDGAVCTADSCDELNDRCVNDPAPLNGVACNDGDLCTTGEVCAGGLCAGGPTCNDGTVCTTDGCTPARTSTGYLLNFDGTKTT